MFNRFNFARGTLRIYIDGFMSRRGQLMSAYREVTVKVLEETPESFRVVYPTRFAKKFPDLCESNIVLKSDAKRSLTYTVFTATDELPPDGPMTYARFTTDVMIPRSGMLCFGEESADVFIVAETDSHYRVRFAAAFARAHPHLCSEWVSKNSTFTKVEPLLAGTC